MYMIYYYNRETSIYCQALGVLMGRIENRPGYEIRGNKGYTNDQTLGNAKMLKIDYKMLKGI